jgi:hypothetical protein
VTSLKEWSVYKLLCPVTTMTRYIGITTQPLDQRLKLHLRGKDHNPGKDEWIAWLQLQGLQPDILSIDSIVGTRAQAECCERHWVYEYIRAGHDLLNINHIPGSRELFFEFLRSQAAETSTTILSYQPPPVVSGTTPRCNGKTGD